MIAGVDDSGVVGAGKDIGHSSGSKQLQHYWLCTENNLLTGAEIA